MLAEFRSFLKTANVLPLAVGVIIGAAVGKVVSALADSIVMPFVGLLLPSGNWREAKVVLHLPSGSETSLLYGQLLGATIDFVIIAFVVFLITRWVIKPLLSSSEEKSRKCPECLESVPETARRCRHARPSSSSKRNAANLRRSRRPRSGTGQLFIDSSCVASAAG